MYLLSSVSSFTLISEGHLMGSLSRLSAPELSKHIWQLKDQKKDFTISWKILTKAKPYSNLTKRCNLCGIYIYIVYIYVCMYIEGHFSIRY